MTMKRMGSVFPGDLGFGGITMQIVVDRESAPEIVERLIYESMNDTRHVHNFAVCVAHPHGVAIYTSELGVECIKRIKEELAVESG
jgi:hypothetical protein